jgi:hypothetical protein
MSKLTAAAEATRQLMSHTFLIEVYDAGRITSLRPAPGATGARRRAVAAAARPFE